MLSRIRRLRALLKGRTDSEHEQAVFRIVIVAVVLAYMLLHHVPGRDSDLATAVLLYSLTIDLVFAFIVFAAICVWPAKNIPRRALGMVADATTATIVVFTTNEAGVAMIGVYLFITFGNGFRYGRKYLFACQALCLLGFGSALLLDSFWRQHQVAGWNLFVALVILPLYVATLLTRIQEAQAKAVEANRAKTTFLANMSHEMRTPLNGIVGAVDLLKGTSLDQEQAELVQLLRHSCDLMRSLVDDVLDISKIEAGRLALEDADFDLHGVLNNLVNLLRPIAKRKGLQFEAQIDPELEYRLCGDSHHLQQILLNFSSNAIKFTNEGSVSLSVTLLDEAADHVRARFEVQDTGIGISEEAQDRIFDHFVQADQSTTRRYGGSGLGTTIAKQLAELMGGSVGVRSQLGKGSCFWCDLPLKKAYIASNLTSARTPSTCALLLGSAEHLGLVRSVAASLEIATEVVANLEDIPATLSKLAQGGCVATAVIVSGPSKAAELAFSKAAAAIEDRNVAMIYVSTEAFPHAGTQATRRIHTLHPDSLARTLANAIHAVITEGVDTAAAEDLGEVFAEARTSLRILVAEDNHTNRIILSQLLRNASHEVILAKDGEEALDLYEEHAPDLAILDFNMPHRNGTDVTKAIRLMEFDHRMPIILLSASVTPESKERAKASGADEFIGKPYDSGQLLRTIDRLAQAKKREDFREKATVLEFGNNIAPIIDTKRLQEIQQLATTSKFLATLIAGYQSDTTKLVDQLRRAASSEERSIVPDLAHALRGAALGIGAAQLAARCAALEKTSMNFRPDQLVAHTLDLEQCVANTNAELNAFLRKQSEGHLSSVGSTV